MHKYIENQLLRLCKKPRTFEYITTSMQGLYPAKIMKLLDDLVLQEKMLYSKPYWWVNSNKTGDKIRLDELHLQKYMGHFNFLKKPHPLDFEWRNTPQSIDFLGDFIIEKTDTSDSIVAMGMPTIFRGLCMREIPQKLMLIERNKPIINDLRKIIKDETSQIIKEADIFKLDPSDVEQCYCVVMDPPWYSNYFNQFVWFASKILVEGGILVISIPPINTRKNIIDERYEWISFLYKQGMCIEELIPCALEYSMPFFEFNSLNAAGVKTRLPFWRNGDLAVFRKHKSLNEARPELKEVSTGWEEIELQSVRIRVKMDTNAQETSSEIKITHLVQSDILQTLSTKYEKRDEANLWTSGNRIYRVSNPSLALSELRKMEANSEYLSEHREFHELISYIVQTEENEYNNYLEWIYYAMEGNSHQQV